jgi:hypothetical protein
MRFPRLAHRSAAAHKLHSTPQQDRMNFISGKGETNSRLPPLAYSSPEAVQTTGTVAFAVTVWDPDSGFGKTCGEPGAATFCNSSRTCFQRNRKGGAVVSN